MKKSLKLTHIRSVTADVSKAKYLKCLAKYLKYLAKYLKSLKVSVYVCNAVLLSASFESIPCLNIT